MKQRLLNEMGGGENRLVEARGSSLFIKRVADLEKSESSNHKGNSRILDSEASPFAE